MSKWYVAFMLSLKKEMRAKKQDFQMTESANLRLMKKAIAIYVK
jgi:hypothetical protein